MPTLPTVSAALQALVDSGDLAGATTAAWRDGRLVHRDAVGWRDIGSGARMTPDAIFRIASVSKPITALAAMILMEEGRFALDDPIARWAPEFAEMRVLKTPDGALDDTAPAARPITFDHLLTHRSGLTYGDFHTGPILPAYVEALGGDIDSPLTPDQWLAAIARLPLIDQPGAGFHYGHSTDVLGLLIARIAGQSLGELMAERVFAPLGMVDTGFVVPPAKRDRRATLYGFDAQGKLTPGGAGAGVVFQAERPAHYTYESGGQGLWSTVDDLLKFARLFVGEGKVGGVRLLKPETLRLMCADHLTDEQRTSATMFGMPAFSGHGFGLGLAVVTDPAKAMAARCKGGVGTVGWPGAYGGWWQADPTDGSAMVLLTHNNFSLEQLMAGIGLGAFAAATQFHTLAKAA